MQIWGAVLPPTIGVGYPESQGSFTKRWGLSGGVENMYGPGFLKTDILKVFEICVVMEGQFAEDLELVRNRDPLQAS